ncbi:hypothetical protein AAFC00_005634 [Neodothiora populina]|uniref:Uncharacterized protein n=1 Tax=Neodothiora populina TaxID=2781224 RepID=A0ABR3PLG9_9PEZI
MDNFRLYTQASAASLAGLAAPLLVSPSLVAWMVSPEPHALTSLESYLSRGFACSLILASFLVLVCSGELKRLYGDDSQAVSLPDDKSVSATITAVSTLVYHLVFAIVLYVHGLDPGLSSSLMTLGGALELLLGIAGLLLLVFRGEGKISKRTGADKRTSGFPFKNAEAARKHK